MNRKKTAFHEKDNYELFINYFLFSGKFYYDKILHQKKI